MRSDKYTLFGKVDPIVLQTLTGLYKPTDLIRLTPLLEEDILDYLLHRAFTSPSIIEHAVAMYKDMRFEYSAFGKNNTLIYTGDRAILIGNKAGEDGKLPIMLHKSKTNYYRRDPTADLSGFELIGTTDEGWMDSAEYLAYISHTSKMMDALNNVKISNLLYLILDEEVTDAMYVDLAKAVKYWFNQPGKNDIKDYFQNLKDKVNSFVWSE